MPLEAKVLYFFTAYEFTQEGVAEVEKSFAKELAKRKLAAEYRYYDTDCYFVVQCWDVQQVYKLFYSILSALINNEKGVDDDDSDNDGFNMAYDPFEDSDEDLQSTKIIRRPRINQQPDRTATLNNPEDVVLVPSNGYPEEIRFFKFRAIWKHEYSLSIDGVFPTPIVKTLEEITGCKLLKDVKGHQFFIGAHYPQYCNDALRKLENILNIAMKVPYVNHVFYTEDLSNIQVAVKPILDIKKRVDTTLLDWQLEGGSDTYDPYKTKVYKSYTVVCCSWDALRGVFLPVKCSKLISTAKDDLGKEFDPWTKFIYCAKGELSGDQTETAQVAILESRIRNALSHEERIQNWRTEIPPDSVTKIHNTLVPMSLAKKQLSTSHHTDFPQGIRSLLDDSPPRIATPVLQPVVYSSSTKDDNNMQAINEVATRTYHNTMNQRSPKPLHAPENKRSKKKGPQLDKIANPLPEFTTKTKSSFYKMLDGLEGFRGKLNIQAEFGRIMLTRIARNDIAPSDTLNSMPPDQLQSILLRRKAEPTAGPHVFFTKVLSTVPADMQYIVDSKNAKNEKAWESKLSWDVVYEIRCLDRRVERDIPFAIFINAETFDMRVMAEEQLLGQIYMHCTKNAWDIRLTAVGLANKDDEYGKVAQTIVNSLYIRSGSTLPELEFELPTSVLQSATPIEIEHVRVRRNCIYKSFDNKTVLKISEVNQLVTLSQPRENGTSYLSSTNHPAALAEKTNSNPGEEYLWYEVSISANNSCFDQNEKVELGEQTGWSVASLEKEDLASALILPALSMVKIMDGVGYHNDNGRGMYLRERATRASSSIGPGLAPYW